MSELLEEPKHAKKIEESIAENALSSLIEATKTVERPGTVKPGDTVTIQFSGDPYNETIRIVDRRNPEHTRDATTEVSLSSPLGMKIIGARVGDIVTYSASGKRTETITIIEINSSSKLESTQTKEASEN